MSQLSLIPQKKPRKVFGRVSHEVDGKTFIIELRKGGLIVRKKYSRNVAAVTLSELVDYTSGQIPIRL